MLSFKALVDLGHGGGGMSWRIRRSLASTMRVSLLSVGGALGFLALSAGAATADDGRSDNGLLGAVTSVVESTTAPAEGIVSELTGALPSSQKAVPPNQPKTVQLSSVSDVVGSVPDVVGSVSVAEVVGPVSNLVDSTVSQVPVVNQVLPGDTAAAVTQPVLETVDSAVAPVLAPVERALSPVIDTLEPVTEVADSVVQPIAPALPVPVDVPRPVEEPVVEEPSVAMPDIEHAEPIERPELTPAAVQEPGATQLPDEAAAGADTGTATAAPDVPDALVTSDNQGSQSHAAVKHEAALVASGAAPSSFDSYFALPEMPTLTAGSAAGNTGNSALSSSPGSAASSAGSGGVGAADAVDAWRFDAIPGATTSVNAASTLLEGPVFDPGSTPD